ncbi:MAG TPA: biotin/lipoyl-binding protein [Candidatus Sulfotelmatobacter sp.]|jgi:HlyD family secretion protein|nr:biotin/lipoyl-binding protein [Candidatus Sulfotelmatobacter sp.]
MSTLFSFIRAKKVYVIVIGIIVLFFIIRAVLLQKPSSDLLYIVKQENLIDTVQVSGTYTTASQTVVVSPSNGIISQLYIHNGAIVKKGQPLFHVESTATTDQQSVAYSDYMSAVSALQTAQNNVQIFDAIMWAKQQSYIAAQNTQNYMNSNAINPSTKQNYTDLEKFAVNNSVTQTQKDFQAAEQGYKTAGVSINAAQAKVTQTKLAYDETQSATIIAPAAGKIVNMQDKVGDAVSAPSTAVTIAGTSNGQAAISTNIPQPVLVIANLSDPYISTNIGEDYATRVATGQKTSIVFDALRNQTFTGTMGDIATVGTSAQGVVTYAARILVVGLPVIIKPNMTALITIETLRRNNVIDVPNSAIITNNSTSYVLEAKTHKQIPVTVGVKGVAKTEITSELTAGTAIVANPNSD